MFHRFAMNTHLFSISNNLVSNNSLSLDGIQVKMETEPVEAPNRVISDSVTTNSNINNSSQTNVHENSSSSPSTSDSTAIPPVTKKDEPGTTPTQNGVNKTKNSEDPNNNNIRNSNNNNDNNNNNNNNSIAFNSESVEDLHTSLVNDHDDISTTTKGKLSSLLPPLN